MDALQQRINHQIWILPWKNHLKARDVRVLWSNEFEYSSTCGFPLWKVLHSGGKTREIPLVPVVSPVARSAWFCNPSTSASLVSRCWSPWTSSGRWTWRGTGSGQVWSLTQFYSLGLLKSRISVKSVFCANTPSRFATGLSTMSWDFARLAPNTWSDLVSLLFWKNCTGQWRRTL